MNQLQFRYRFCLLIISTILCLGFTACKEDDANEPEIDNTAIFPGVDERLVSYFLSFEIEASRRGYLIDLGELGVTGVIRPINGAGQVVVGRCTFNEEEPNHLVIDQAFWESSSNRLREFIIFHELGHCVLYRGHRDEQDSNGFCLSIMRSSNAVCRENYFSTTRTTLLDELFDAQFVDELKDED